MNQIKFSFVDTNFLFSSGKNKREAGCKIMNTFAMRQISKIIWVFIVVIIFCLNNSSVAQVTFQKTYGNINGNEANTVILTNSGGYGMAGWYDVEGLFSAEFYLIITDVAGDTLWTRTYGEKSDTTINIVNGSGNEGYSLTQTSDNGFLFVGERHAFAGGQSDAYAVRLDNEGELLWAKTYGGGDNDYAYAVSETDDGGFVMAGFTESYGAGIRDMYLFKTDNTGELDWARTYGGTSIDAAFDMQQTADGGFILVGYTFSFSGSSDIYVIRTDATGEVLWQKTYGGALNDIGHAILQTEDGGFIICGETESFGVENIDAYLVKIDEDGIVEWSKAYGGEEFEAGKSIAISNDGGYVFVGYTRSFGAGGEDLYLVKTDGVGELVWTKIFGGEFDDSAQSIKSTADNGYVMTGYTKSFGTGFSDVYLIKTDDLGDSGCEQGTGNTQVTDVLTIETSITSIVQDGGGVLEPNTIAGYTNTGISDPCDFVDAVEALDKNPMFQIYPNPAMNYLTIETNEQSTLKRIQVTIYDMLGREVQSFKLNGGNDTIDVSLLPKGIFILNVFVDGESFSYKFLKD